MENLLLLIMALQEKSMTDIINHVLDFAGVADETKDVIVDAPIASVIFSVFLCDKAIMKPLILNTIVFTFYK